MEIVRRAASGAGDLVTRTFDGGRPVSVYVPVDPVEAVVFAGDGELLAPWGDDLAAAPGVPPTMVVGVHRSVDETARLHEYSPGFAPALFAAHEAFLMGEVRRWVGERFGVDLPAARTAAFGVSAGAELALALGLGHPDVFGVVLAASPGAGYRPPEPLPPHVPQVYLVAGDGEPFFRDNARRWERALTGGGAEVVMTERAGEHGGDFWRQELPLMVAWAFGSDRGPARPTRHGS